MEKHSKDFLIDTLVKLQAMQNNKNNAPQVYLRGRSFLLFYTAPAVHEDEAKRNPNGHGANISHELRFPLKPVCFCAIL